MRLILLASALVTVAFTGCAGTWDKVSSRKFRNDPMSAFRTEDAMTVLRTKVDGNERAAAMRKLKEPSESGGTAAEQDEALQILNHAATTDPSPVIRTAAIDALGRFRDPRCVKILIDAYQKADGIAEGSVLAKGPGGVEPVGSLDKKSVEELLGLNGPLGFQTELTTTIRQRALAALAQSNAPEAVAFLGKVAVGGAKGSEEKPEDREVRVAAVRGLSQMRQKQSVVALAQVLQTETGKDLVLAGRAHEGLVDLTGQNLPADPAKWNTVVQTGFEISAGPSWVERTMAPLIR